MDIIAVFESPEENMRTYVGAKNAPFPLIAIETAKENGLHPFKYLMHLFEKLLQLEDPRDPKSLEPFLPWSSSIPLISRVFTS